MNAAQLRTIKAFEIATGQVGSLAAWRRRGEQAGGAELILGGRRVGIVWNDRLGKCCCLDSIIPANSAVSSAAQFDAVFADLDRALVRTWFVLNPIVAAYGEFNRVRSQYFRAWGLHGQRTPTSTAVGADNSSHCNVAAGALAIEPCPEQLRVTPVASPLQGAAANYGSAFSRATSFVGPWGRRLFVSGTASIDAVGNTLHPGNAEAQFGQTLSILDALITSHDYEWADVQHAVAYFKRAVDGSLCARLVERCCHADVRVAVADICRDELQFELELELAQGGL